MSFGEILKLAQMSNVPLADFERYAYQGLGLEDPDAFALKMMRHNLSEEKVAVLGAKAAIEGVYRATGRTTRMMIKALWMMAQGEAIRFSAYSTEYAIEIQKNAHEYALALGITPLLASACRHDNVPGGQFICTFHDHYLGAHS